MLNTKTNPFNSGWYLVKVKGQNLPMQWNPHNKFYAGVDGKCYNPSEIDGWISEDEAETIQPVTEGIKKGMKIVLNLDLVLRDTGEMSPKAMKERLEGFGSLVKQYLNNALIGYYDGDVTIASMQTGIMPELKTLGELEAEGSI